MEKQNINNPEFNVVNKQKRRLENLKMGIQKIAKLKYRQIKIQKRVRKM